MEEQKLETRNKRQVGFRCSDMKPSFNISCRQTLPATPCLPIVHQLATGANVCMSVVSLGEI